MDPVLTGFVYRAHTDISIPVSEVVDRTGAKYARGICVQSRVEYTAYDLRCSTGRPPAAYTINTNYWRTPERQTLHNEVGLGVGCMVRLTLQVPVTYVYMYSYERPLAGGHFAPCPVRIYSVPGSFLQ